jgi:hypothetical protein
VGQEVRVYATYLELPTGGVGFAEYIDLDPPKPAPAKTKLKLERLNARTNATGLLFFSLIAGLIGLTLGAVDGLICRVFRRALLAGSVGLLVGVIGGFVSNIIANLVYTPVNSLAMDEIDFATGSISTFGFAIQMIGRTLAWCLAGMAMGLGQGIALRSKRLLLYGFLGGIIGGIFGGLLFDPIDLLLLGFDKPSAHWSRLIGIVVIGGSVGAMIGVVELLARNAWLRMVEGPLAGKEFILFKDTMKVGASTRSDIYLFNDPDVAQQHAVIRTTGDIHEIESSDQRYPIYVNTSPITRSRLRHGDRITIGRTVFVFEQRQT